MKKNWKRVTLTASVLALSALLVFAGAAFAMGPGDQNTPGFYGNDGTSSSYGIGVRGAWAGGEGSLVEVAAQVIGIERIDLVAELSESISIADAAANHDVDPQAIVDTYLAIRSDFLAQMVDAGRITQEQANLMLAEMADNVLADLNEPWVAQGGNAGNSYNLADGNGYRSSASGQVDGLDWLDEDGDGQCDNYDGTVQNQANLGPRGGRWNR